MAAPRTGSAMTFVRPAVVLARLGMIVGILAITAGIFGMHVMTATHIGHGSAVAGTTTSGVVSDGGSDVAAPVAESPVTASPDHGGHQQAGATAPESRPVLVPRPAHSALAAAPVCSGSGHNTTGMVGMANGCVLAPGNTALAAPLPSIARLVSGNGPLLPGNSPWPSSSYVPSSPSPGELSISRT